MTGKLEPIKRLFSNSGGKAGRSRQSAGSCHGMQYNKQIWCANWCWWCERISCLISYIWLSLQLREFKIICLRRFYLQLAGICYYGWILILKERTELSMPLHATTNLFQRNAMHEHKKSGMNDVMRSLDRWAEEPDLPGVILAMKLIHHVSTDYLVQFMVQLMNSTCGRLVCMPHILTYNRYTSIRSTTTLAAVYYLVMAYSRYGMLGQGSTVSTKDSSVTTLTNALRCQTGK